MNQNDVDGARKALNKSIEINKDNENLILAYVKFEI